jgi:hypothetical protein
VAVQILLKRKEGLMVTDEQVRRLRRMVQTEKMKVVAASKAGMDVKTARKYLRNGKLPSQVKPEHGWRTREDPFGEVWGEVEELLKGNAGLESKTIFEWLQGKYPGRYGDGQVRTLQRKVRKWRVLEGAGKEVYFAQKHHPGELCASDFTHMGELEITIEGQRFDHLMYHFVLTYSNWETGTVCFGESFESLSEGLQNALWELGGAPKRHRTDRLSSAVRRVSSTEARFTESYEGLLRHYGLRGEKIQAGKAHENGDVEQRHHRFKRAMEQALLLRGSRDFGSREEYGGYVRALFTRLNAGREERFREECVRLGRLPAMRLDDAKRLRVKVGCGSTIRVQHNVYSVSSGLMGEWVEARVYAEWVEVWYGQQMVERMPRLRGSGKHRIEYRHVIDSLVRKPGAFEQYRYREDLFPTSRFRMAYDQLRERNPLTVSKEYLKILAYAASEGESVTDDALAALLDGNMRIDGEAVREAIETAARPRAVRDVIVREVDLTLYDQLLLGEGVR